MHLVHKLKVARGQRSLEERESPNVWPMYMRKLSSSIFILEAWEFRNLKCGLGLCSTISKIAIVVEERRRGI